MRTYEDFAEIAFGSKRWRTVVAIAMIVSLLGFTTAYISLSKTLIPSIVAASVSAETYVTLPYWLQDNKKSKVVWATIFSFGILLPLACFRKLSMLRYTSLFGVVCSSTILLVLIYEFAFDEIVVPQPPSS
jgi:amino acid permease